MAQEAIREVAGVFSDKDQLQAAIDELGNFKGEVRIPI